MGKMTVKATEGEKVEEKKDSLKLRSQRIKRPRQHDYPSLLNQKKQEQTGRQIIHK